MNNISTAAVLRVNWFTQKRFCAFISTFGEYLFDMDFMEYWMRTLAKITKSHELEFRSKFSNISIVTVTWIFIRYQDNFLWLGSARPHMFGRVDPHIIHMVVADVCLDCETGKPEKIIGTTVDTMSDLWLDLWWNSKNVQTVSCWSLIHCLSSGAVGFSSSQNSAATHALMPNRCFLILIGNAIQGFPTIVIVHHF